MLLSPQVCGPVDISGIRSVGVSEWFEYVHPILLGNISPDYAGPMQRYANIRRICLVLDKWGSEHFTDFCWFILGYMKSYLCDDKLLMSSIGRYSMVPLREVLTGIGGRTLPGFSILSTVLLRDSTLTITVGTTTVNTMAFKR